MASPSLAVAAALLLALARTAPAAAADAELTLRKSFPERPAVGAATAPGGGRGAGEASAPDSPAPPLPPAFPAALAALGEELSGAGTLHLPDVAGRNLALDTAVTPLVELASGRRLILDGSGSIAPADADAIARRWPSYGVLRPEPGSGARALLASLLASAHYESVMRSTPITFGGGTAIRIRPDYLVLRTADDLLTGEMRAISVLDSPADALPEELRELAARHRILVLELLDADGAPAAGGGWRDPVGRVTTVGTQGSTLVVLELADALGATVREAPGDPSPPGALRLERGPAAVTVLTRRPGSGREADAGAVDAGDPARITAALGEILARLDIPAIGPAVELSRPRRGGGERRFTITVPGWLAEPGGRRLLVTGADLPPPLRLFLAREGIDILEYRVGAGPGPSPGR